MGIARCTNGLFQAGPLFPTPVCILTTCNPAPTDGANPDPNGDYIHFCDGPDQSTSPGVCVPSQSNPGTGICYPACLYADDGKAAAGCTGKDACSPFAFGTDSNGAPIGIGVCFGGCTQDSDCPASADGGTTHCDTLTALCQNTVTAPTKSVGDSCTKADSTSNACNCEYNTTSGNGYCSTACITGGAACPTGYSCDAFSPKTLDFGDAGTKPGFAQQNPGLLGTCFATCTPSDAGSDAADDAGGAASGCPASATCKDTTVAGPNCQP